MCNTIESTNSASRQYTIRGEATWKFDGSGWVDNTTLAWELENQNPLTGDDKFAEKKEGRIVPRALTEGTRANAALLTRTWETR